MDGSDPLFMTTGASTGFISVLDEACEECASSIRNLKRVCEKLINDFRSTIPKRIRERSETLQKFGKETFLEFTHLPIHINIA